MTDTLTLSDATRLARVLEAPTGNRKVARTTDGGETVVYGVARHIVRSETDHGFLVGDPDFDVRDACLRVTSKTGFDFFWPIRDLMADLDTGAFALYDWS